MKIFIRSIPYWLPLVFFPWANDAFFTVKESLFFMALLPLLFLSFCEKKYPLPVVLVPYGGFILIGFFSAFFNQSFPYSFSFLLIHAASFFYLTLVPFFLPRKLVNIVLLIVSMILFFQFWGVDIVFTQRIRGVEASFMAGTMGHKNFIAEVILYLTPFLSVPLRGIYWGALFLTLSRSGILSFFSQFGASLFMWHNGYAKAMLFFLSAFLLLVLAVPMMRSGFIERARFKRDWAKGSFLTRRMYWDAALRMGQDHLLIGVGSGGFSWRYWQFYPKIPLHWRQQLVTRHVSAENPTSVHNDFLQVFAEAGLIGLFSYLFLHFYIFFSVWRGKGSTLLVYLSFLVSSLFQSPLQNPQVFPLVLFLCLDGKRQLTFRWSFGRQSVLGFIAGWFLISGLFQMSSEVYLYQGRAARERGNIQYAIARFTQSITLHKTAKAYFYRGMAKEASGDKTFLADYLLARQRSGNLHIDWALARGYAKLGNFKNAERGYRTLLSLHLWDRYQKEWSFELKQVEALSKKAKRKAGDKVKQ